jgi:hypothetical protein
MKPINLTQKEIQRACDGLTVVTEWERSKPPLPPLAKCP